MRQNLRFPCVALRSEAWLLLVFSGCFIAGCGSSAKLMPVEGKVTLDGKPLPAGHVTLIADATKGNQSAMRLSGIVNKDGMYRIESERGRGAPIGAYKVIVFQGLPMPGIETSVTIPEKYQNEETTDLQVEVTQKSAPGAHNLQLKTDP
jgi:hypothetical protein